MRYIHFTDYQGAKGILSSGVLMACSYLSGAYAVVVGGAYVPGVQRTALGVAGNRDVAVVFETADLPDTAFVEEVIWHMPKVAVFNAVIISAEKAIGLLDESLVDIETDEIDIPLHPSTSSFDGVVRL